MTVFGPFAACSDARETLRTSFDHSEFHNWSVVTLDVPTGAFVAVFRDGIEDTGRFSSQETRHIQDLLKEARSTGFANAQCVRTPRRERTTIVISNGGTGILELRDGPTHLRAAEDIECWTNEAKELHDYIDQTLWDRGDAWRMPSKRTRLGKRY